VKTLKVCGWIRLNQPKTVTTLCWTITFIKLIKFVTTFYLKIPQIVGSNLSEKYIDKD